MPRHDDGRLPAFDVVGSSHIVNGCKNGRILGYEESSLDSRTLRAGTDVSGVWFAPEDQLERRESHCLSSPGLTRQGRQSSGQFEPSIGDDTEILYCERLNHRTPPGPGRAIHAPAV